MMQLGLILIVAALVAADQLTKWLAVVFLKGSDPLSVIPHIFSFTYTENTGAAWSMFEGQRWLLIGVTSVMMVIVLLILLSGRFKNHRLATFGGVLVVAGGFGNLIDRVFRGYVVDFLQTDFINFPIFNVADCFVVIGALLLFVYFMFFYSDTSVPAQAEDQEEKEVLSSGNTDDQHNRNDGENTP